jgi:hypothetical protein
LAAPGNALDTRPTPRRRAHAPATLARALHRPGVPEGTMARIANDTTAEVNRTLGVSVSGLEPAGARSPDALAELFAPDIVLPEQLVQGFRRDSFVSGEKALMLAVLEDGIRCFQEHLRNPRSNPRLLSQEAEAWIRAVDYDWPFSFNNVCETLGIDAEALRAALLKWKAARLAALGDSKPTPADKKVYRLHLRTKRMSGIR